MKIYVPEEKLTIKMIEKKKVISKLKASKSFFRNELKKCKTENSKMFIEGIAEGFGQAIKIIKQMD